MHRHAAALVIALTLAPSPLFAQQFLQAPAAPQATPPPNQVFIDREDAQTTRQRLQELLRQHPPAVGEVLRRDPALANPDYLAPYPALVTFLQQHPEIARNPSYFFGGFDFSAAPQLRDPSYLMFRDMTQGLGFLLVLGALLGAFLWLVRSVIDQRRWLRVSRTQAEVHTKLLDRMTNNDDLLAYIQTPAGRRFLESGPIMSDGEAPSRAGAPLSRIIWSLQAGIVLACLGAGFWVAETRFPEDTGEGFFLIGTLATALGLGFAISAGAAYAISTRFGLMTPPPAATHE